MKFSNERALTVIELLIVLAILGILSVLSWEGQKALLKKYQITGVSRTLVSDLRAIQQRAVASRRICWIELEPESGGYSSWMSQGEGPARLLRQIRLPEVIRFGFQSGVKGPPSNPGEIGETDGITFRDNRVVFSPNGGLGRGAGTIYLADRSVGGSTHAITVSVSGHVRHYSWVGGQWK